MIALQQVVTLAKTAGQEDLNFLKSLNFCTCGGLQPTVRWNDNKSKILTFYESVIIHARRMQILADPHDPALYIPLGFKTHQFGPSDK